MKAKAEQLKLLKDESENELEDVSFDDLFKTEEPGPDAKIQMEPDEEKGSDIPLKSTRENNPQGPEQEQKDREV